MIDDAARARISAAIAAAEARTSGEIVCLIARRASDWRMWPLAYAGALALAVPMVALAMNTWAATPWSAATIYAVQLAVFLALSAAGLVPAVRLAMVPKSARQARAHRAAVEQFAARGLTGTRQRTGVLIYVAVAERSAQIIADRGIYQKVGPEVWREAVDALTQAIRRGDPAAGFEAAIGAVGAVLAAHFPRAATDVDELPNRLIEI
jgi:putative membrane protein